MHKIQNVRSTLSRSCTTQLSAQPFAPWAQAWPLRARLRRRSRQRALPHLLGHAPLVRLEHWLVDDGRLPLVGALDGALDQLGWQHRLHTGRSRQVPARQQLSDKRARHVLSYTQQTNVGRGTGASRFKQGQRHKLAGHTSLQSCSMTCQASSATYSLHNCQGSVHHEHTHRRCLGVHKTLTKYEVTLELDRLEALLQRNLPCTNAHAQVDEVPAGGCYFSHQTQLSGWQPAQQGAREAVWQGAVKVLDGVLVLLHHLEVRHDVGAQAQALALRHSSTRVVIMTEALPSELLRNSISVQKAISTYISWRTNCAAPQQTSGACVCKGKHKGNA